MTPAPVQRLCEFVDASPTAYHAVDNMAAALEVRGAQRLAEGSAWELEPGKAYFVVRSGSALVAFRPGLVPAAGEGFAIAGAHTDSPALKARIEKTVAARGMERAAVEVYGGPILSTWLDRPLALAGRVVVKEADGKLRTRLLNIIRPVGIVPNLAIHLNRDLNKGFEYNAQTHLPVLLSSELPDAGTVLSMGGGQVASKGALLALVTSELGVDAEAIFGADLYFVESQKTAIVGKNLVNGYRLDDLLGCHAILEAFSASKPEKHGQVACFFDNEEIGSRTVQGADSSFLRDLLGRICALGGATTEDFYRALASSFSVSVDVAQAWNPAYPEKYDESYAPLLNGGPAVKVNANYRYATDAESEARFRLLCEAAAVPCQKFMSRADIAPGSTIGPMFSALLGIRTVDVGSPLLSMHSIRETAGLRDHEAMSSALARHFASSPKA